MEDYGRWRRDIRNRLAPSARSVRASIVHVLVGAMLMGVMTHLDMDTSSCACTAKASTHAAAMCPAQLSIPTRYVTCTVIE